MICKTAKTYWSVYLNSPAVLRDFLVRNYQPEQFVVRLDMVIEVGVDIERERAQGSSNGGEDVLFI
jgi:hypothetical protein